MSMISVAEVNERLQNESRVLTDAESITLRDSCSRVLAADIVAAINVPPADNSAMDGYALRLADWRGADKELEISQRITAGIPAKPLSKGTVARIFTGAEIPPGADIVVMQEKCSVHGKTVCIDDCGTPGANIRKQGEDINIGTRILAAGHRLRAQDIGLIASLGIAHIKVMRPLKVAIISTGSELVEPGEAVKAGQIYNSNRYMLAAFLENWGFEVVDMGIIADNPQALDTVLTDASHKADVIITSGGVSVGEEDHVKAVVESLGQLDLWRVAIKPGKPFAFGRVLGTPFIGLPGNPVSALITMLIIARPFLLSCQGRKHLEIVPVRQTALFDKKGSARQEYPRVRMGADGVEIFTKQGSGVLFSSSWGDGLLVQKPAQEIKRGDLVDVIPFQFFN